MAEDCRPVFHAVAHQAPWQDGVKSAEGHRKLQFAFVKNVPEPVGDLCSPAVYQVLSSPGTVTPLDGSVWSLYYVSLEGKDALWA